MFAARMIGMAATGVRRDVVRAVLPWLLSPMLAVGAHAAAPTRFEVDEYRVEGNTVLSQTDIETAVYPFLGPDKSIDDVEHARAALDAALARAGFATVSAELPEQRVQDGVVRLTLRERSVGRLRVTGSRYYALGTIRAGAPSLAEGSVPNMKQVQREIVALNQLPDRVVTPVLRAGAAPDTVDVDLQVQDTPPLHGTLEVDNRQSPGTTPLRVSGSLHYDNLWQRGDSASVSFQVAPQNTNDAEVFSGSYLYHIPGSTLSLLGSFLHSNSNVATVGSTNVVGRGDIAGFRLLLPLGYGEGFVHSLSAGIDYKHFDENVLLGADTSKTPITYYPLTATYQADWTGPVSQTAVDASLVMALRGLGSSAATYDAKRYDATPNFAYVRAEASRLQNLPHDMQFYARLQGQVAPEPLISNEQFSVGGLDSVRGYFESEGLGDTGAALQTELRSPSLSALVPGARVNDLRVHAFYDVGTTYIHNPLADQTTAYTLNSVGVGTRVRVSDYLYGSLEDAWALSRGPNTRSGVNRILFRVYGSF